MKSIKIIKTCFLILLSLALFSGCKNPQKLNESKPLSSENVEEIKDEVNGFIKNRYIVNDPLYQIIELSTEEQPFGPYYYKIGTSKKTFAKGTHNREPRIDVIGDGIIKLFMAFGSNAFSLQYFDVWNDRTSEDFAPYATYADYVDTKTGECLVAYFGEVRSYGENVLLIKDIFNKQGFSTEIAKGFFSATCNRITFLNENEIYLDYEVFADGYSEDDLIAGNSVEWENIQEVVKFRNN